MPLDATREDFSHRDLIYDWNDMGETLPPPMRATQFDDETLRDGLQAPSVKAPTIQQKFFCSI